MPDTRLWHKLLTARVVYAAHLLVVVVDVKAFVGVNKHLVLLLPLVLSLLLRRN